jgi:hypothetical protein
MPLDNDRFIALCETLLKVNLFGKGPPAPPWQSPTVASVTKAIEKGHHQLPFNFQREYVAHLVAKLPTVLARGGDPEPYAAPVYEHATSSAVRPQLNRFLAVISDLYRSFLSKSKRAMINVPIREQLPPVAFFQNDGGQGPYTIPSDDTFSLFGSTVGIVSLPSTYRDHPLLWASLAHEVGGHDITHADPGLLDQLSAGERALFGGGPIQPGGEINQSQLLGILWSFWIDEAAADVYGVLNIGPEFTLNLTAFFAALGGRARLDAGLPLGPFPLLRTDTGENPDTKLLDEHPTDLLRLHLAIGVIENLASLSPAIRTERIAEIEQLATLCANGATTVTLNGPVRLKDVGVVPLNQVTFPLGVMQDASRRVGGFIATATPNALAGHSVQDIETWDDADEAAARKIAELLGNDESVVEMGDDAQLLSGATLASVTQPDQVDRIIARLNEALDSSFSHDPIWGPPVPQQIARFGPFTTRAPKRARKQKASA